MLRRLRQSRNDASVTELGRRLDRLEAQLEALQDAVHRDAMRRDEEQARLEQKTQPAEIARALGDDARRRGLQ